MAGFFGLFGNNAKYVDETETNKSSSNGASNGSSNGSSPAPMSNDNSFFLDSDNAKSLGDIDYMRKSKNIRRTFPKTATNQVGELIKKVSATEDQKIDNSEYASISSSTNGSVAKEEAKKVVAERRSTDTSMDMFRDMARNMKR